MEGADLIGSIFQKVFNHRKPPFHKACPSSSVLETTREMLCYVIFHTFIKSSLKALPRIWVLTQILYTERPSPVNSIHFRNIHLAISTWKALKIHKLVSYNSCPEGIHSLIGPWFLKVWFLDICIRINQYKINNKNEDSKAPPQIYWIKLSGNQFFILKRFWCTLNPEKNLAFW